jgi:DNA-binding NarL/FixJ family response regulator
VTPTVLLVDDHALIRRGLRSVFERDGEFTVVGEAATVQEALAAFDRTDPQVVVLNLTMPGGTGFDVIRSIRARCLATGIVVCSVHPSDDVLLELLKVGASAFVSKESPVEDVIAAARYAFVSPRASTARDLAGAISRRSPGGPQLSPRERDVLALLKRWGWCGSDRRTALHQQVRGQGTYRQVAREVGAWARFPRCGRCPGAAPPVPVDRFGSSGAERSERSGLVTCARRCQGPMAILTGSSSFPLEPTPLDVSDEVLQESSPEPGGQP